MADQVAHSSKYNPTAPETWDGEYDPAMPDYHPDEPDIWLVEDEALQQEKNLNFAGMPTT